MKKRLSIAKAMLARPSVLLLDEAYASLDERGVDMMNAYIREVTREGTTVLITAHDRAKTAEVAHRAGVLNRGELRELAVNELLTAHALF